MRRTLILMILGLVVVLAAVPAALAQHEDEEELGNNLSVPTIFVPDMIGAPALRVPAPGTAKAPGWDGIAANQDGGTVADYWEQATLATWSAGTTIWGAAGRITADWGDNLAGDSPQIRSRPLRVEVGLLHPRAMTGYVMTNLTPDLPDRNATFGTDGTPFVSAYPGEETILPARVWDTDAGLIIKKLVDGTWSKVIYDGPYGTEINKAGAITYGYNWGMSGTPPAAGTYKLVAHFSKKSTITGVADAKATFKPHRTILIIKVV